MLEEENKLTEQRVRLQVGHGQLYQILSMSIYNVFSPGYLHCLLSRLLTMSSLQAIYNVFSPDYLHCLLSRLFTLPSLQAMKRELRIRELQVLDTARRNFMDNAQREHGEKLQFLEDDVSGHLQRDW